MKWLIDHVNCCWLIAAVNNRTAVQLRITVLNPPAVRLFAAAISQQ